APYMNIRKRTLFPTLCICIILCKVSTVTTVAAEAAVAEPPVVDPGQPGGPPSDAIVLFDGKDLSKWRGAKGEAAGWLVENGYAEVNGKGYVFSREEFGDVQLHVEWAAPAEVKGTGQGRGNSGVYLMGRYEIQV